MAKRFTLIPFLLFVVSGACGLVYEVTWAKYLSLFLGNTTLAHMCVLAAFMGGLALGSIAIGRLTGNFRRPLAVYGWLEVAIGLYAILFPLFIHPVQSWTLSLASRTDPGDLAWLGLKLLVSMGVLLLPTFLMGGTFPVLMRHFQPESSDREDKSEWLYLVNCAGAVGGSLIAGFYLIPNIGLSSTLTGIGLLNTLLGLSAAGVAMMEPPAARVKREIQAATGRSARDPRVTAVYVAIGVSGLAAMIYELVWIRMFAVTLGSSTYSFTLMLAAFISGIALGSVAVGVSSRIRQNPVVWFAVAEIAIGLTVLLSFPIYERLTYLFWKWSSILQPSPDVIWLYNLVKYGTCFVVMVVPTFFSGMTLPLAIKVVARRDESIGEDSGYIYGANTAGTLLGALLTGLVLLPAVGLRHSLEIAIAINIAAGLLLVWAGKLRLRYHAIGMTCVVTAGLMILMPDWSPISFAFGTFRQPGRPPSTWSLFRESRANMRVLYYNEDDDGTVAVMETEGIEGTALFINGKADASSYGDMPTQVLVGQLPMFFRPDAKDVLIVGLGSGATAGSVLTHPQTRVDCVEISPAVIEAARLFSDVNWKALDNPRLNVIVEDARSFVAAAPKKYDVIISEPSNPWIAGIGNLFSQEYYQSAAKALKEDGLLVQWVQTYETTDDLVKMIFRTISTVFPCAYVFEGVADDYVILASRRPITPDFRAMEERMKSPMVGADLERISIDSVAALLVHQVLSPVGVATLGGEGGINCDDLPLLEYGAPFAQYLKTTSKIISAHDERFGDGNRLFLTEYLRSRPLNQASVRSMIIALSDPRVRSEKLARALVREYVSRWPNDPWGLERYAMDVAQTDSSSALKAAELLAKLRQDGMGLELQADILFARKLESHSAITPQDFRPVLKLLDQALARDPENPELRQKREQVAGMIP